MQRHCIRYKIPYPDRRLPNASDISFSWYSLQNKIIPKPETHTFRDERVLYLYSGRFASRFLDSTHLRAFTNACNQSVVSSFLRVSG